MKWISLIYFILFYFNFDMDGTKENCSKKQVTLFRWTFFQKQKKIFKRSLLNRKIVKSTQFEFGGNFCGLQSFNKKNATNVNKQFFGLLF